MAITVGGDVLDKKRPTWSKRHNGGFPDQHGLIYAENIGKARGEMRGDEGKGEQKRHNAPKISQISKVSAVEIRDIAQKQSSTSWLPATEFLI